MARGKVPVKSLDSKAKKGLTLTGDRGDKSNKGAVKDRGKHHGKAKWHPDRSVGVDLATELAALGLRIKDITGDGNCFFRALGDQLQGDERAHVSLRQQVVAYIIEHEEDFAPFVEDDESFGTYIARMKKDGVWAGYMEVVAASKCLGANLTIYQAGQPRWRVVNHSEDTAPMLHLSYHDGKHYNSVRCAEDYGTGPPAPVVIRGNGTLSVAARPQRSAGDSQWDERDERRVAESTACTDLGLIRRALEQAAGDIEAAIEKVIEALAAAEVVDGMHDHAVSVTSNCDASTTAQQEPSVPGERMTQGAQPMSAAPSAQGAEEASLSQSTDSAAQHARQHATADRDIAGCDSLVAGGSGGGTKPEGAVVSGIVEEPLRNALGPGSVACASDATAPKGPQTAEPEGPAVGRAAEGGGRKEKKKAAVAGVKKSACRKSGGTAAAAASGGPSNNKRCPCGSNKKYKACCGPAAAAVERRKAAVGSGVVVEQGEPAKGMSVVVAQVAALVI